MNTTSGKSYYEMIEEHQREREKQKSILQQAFNEAYQEYVKRGGRIYGL